MLPVGQELQRIWEASHNLLIIDNRFTIISIIFVIHLQDKAMKKYSIFIVTWTVLLLSVFFSCSKSDDIEEPKPSFREQEVAFMKEFRKKVRGSWEVDSIVMTKDCSRRDPSNDTTIFIQGRIHINDIYSHPIEPDWYNQLKAMFYLNRDIIPFKSNLLGHVGETMEENVTTFDGATGLMESNMILPKPVMHWDEFTKEYQFLSEYFFGDNYTISVSEDGKTSTWEGLSRHIRKIMLSRN